MTALLGVDATKVSNGAARTALVRTVKQVAPTTPVNFWTNVKFGAGKTYYSVLVFCDFKFLLNERDRLGIHKFVERSRRNNVGYCAVLSTPTERKQVSQIDTTLQTSGCRFLLVEAKSILDRSAVPEIGDFVGRLKPEALFGATYSLADGTLGLHFGDGRFFGIPWKDLPLSQRSPRFLPETAVVKYGGSVLQVVDEAGNEFDIDAEALRAICDPAVQDKIQHENRAVRTQVGETVRARRLAAGFTQQQLSESSGVDQEVISRIEQGHQRPRIDTLQKIASAMGIGVSELLSRTPRQLQR